MVMELPYLKRKNNSGGGGPIERDREPDESNPDQLIEGVADEFMDAIQKKDRAGLVSALRALVMMIQDEDQKQDEGM